MPTFVQRQYLIIEALDPHLYLGHAELAQASDLAMVDKIGTGFNHQSDILMDCSFIGLLRLMQIQRVRAIHGIQAALDEPLLIVKRIGTPSRTEDQEFNFLCWVTDRFQRLYSSDRLFVGFEGMVECAHRPGFIREIGLRHALFRWTEDAVSWTRIGFREHRYGSDAR